jgi:hypothetical protein
MIYQFRNIPGRFHEVRRKLLLTTLPITLISMIGGVALFVLNRGTDTPLLTYLFMIPVLLGTVFIGKRNAIRKQEDIYDSYRLVISDQYIRREQNNTPDLTIARNEISKIVKLPDGAFVVKGQGMMNQVTIPAQIEQHEVVEELLTEIGTVTPVNPLPLSIPAAILGVGLFAAVVASANKTVVGICGSLLVVIAGYSLVLLWMNKNVDRKTRNRSLVVLIMLASVIATMWYKLTA